MGKQKRWVCGTLCLFGMFSATLKHPHYQHLLPPSSANKAQLWDPMHPEATIVPGWRQYYQACTACWKYEHISRLHKTTYHFIYLRLYCGMAWHAAWSMPCPKTCSTKDLFQSLNISPWPNIRSIRSRWAAAVRLRLAPFLPVKLQVQPKWPSFLQTKQMNSVELNPYCDF